MKNSFLLTICLVFGNFFTLDAQDVEWAHAIGGSEYTQGTSVITDASGNVYTTGFFLNTVDFDPGAGVFDLTSVGGSDIFIQKLDANGNFLWAKSLGGSLAEQSRSITLDAVGNIYITGIFQDTMDVDLNPDTTTQYVVSNGSSDAFILKMDVNGNFVWAKSFGGTDGDGGNSIKTDAAGNVYTIGSFRSTVDFDPGVGTEMAYSGGFDDIFIQKLDANGNFVWVKTFSGGGQDYGTAITIDNSGNLLATGQYGLTIDFDPSAGVNNLTAVNAHDIFILKLDANGDFIWAKSIGGVDNDKGESITTDTAGNVFTTGSFWTSADFDPNGGTFTLTSNGYPDIFIQKMDANGNFLWAKSMGSFNGETGFSVCTDIAGNVYTTGYFRDSIDFDPGVGTYMLASNGLFWEDIFLQKLDANGNLVWAHAIGSSSYDEGKSIFVDASNNIYATGYIRGTADFDPGVGVYNLVSGGPENAFILKFSQCAANTSVSLSGTTLTALANGATYQWVDCNNGNAPISGETGQAFTPTTNGNYAVEVTESGCTATSICTNIDVTGIIVSDYTFATTVFPNPTTTQLHIESELLVQQAQIYSINGALLKDIAQPNKTLDVSDLPQGMYILMLKTEQGYVRAKFVKE